MKTLARILGYFEKSDKVRFFGVVIALVSTSIVETLTLMILIPYIGIIGKDPSTISYVNKILNGIDLTNTQLFVGFTSFFLLMIVMKSLLQLNSNYQMTKFSYHYYQTKNGQLFKKYLNQNYLSFVDQDTGTLVKNCTQTSYYATQAILQQLQVLSSFFITLFLFAAILFQDFGGSLCIVLLFGVTSLIIYQFNKKPVKRLGKDLIDATKNAYQCVLESLHLFKEVKIYKKSSYFIQKFDDYNASISRNYRYKEFLSMTPSVLIELMAVVLLILVVCYVYFNDAITSQFVAGLIFYAAVGRRILPAINHMTQQAIHLQHSLESLDVFEQEIEKTHEERQPLKTKTFREFITFEQISFSYRKGSQILDRVSFEIPKNASVAFVGPSGGGKSTIIDILIGLIQPSSGQILVDGEVELNMTPFQKQIGYVPQSIALINHSIARNVALGEEVIDHKRLNDAIAASHLEEFIASLPEGIDTHVGDRGIKVSGGQMQRIGIARALYRQPELIIFDEATSSLDNLSELVIAQSIKEMMGKKTIVAVAHRLSTIKNFDRIYVLDRGQVIAEGTHNELVQKCSLYQTLNRFYEKVS
ncbi:MAG: ATM1-type heavy metal exporter [Chlamydiae bacterium]|nr:ATM1-type heavy metal exporter [Chlamydiota bacterium]